MLTSFREARAKTRVFKLCELMMLGLRSSVCGVESRIKNGGSYGAEDSSKQEGARVRRFGGEPGPTASRRRLIQGVSIFHWRTILSPRHRPLEADLTGQFQAKRLRNKLS